MVTPEALERWRHLIEPEMARCVTPMTWAEVLGLADTSLLYEDKASVMLVRGAEIAGDRVCTIVVAAGVLEEMWRIAALVERDARAAGFRRVLFLGRRGWTRIDPGYV